MCHMRNALRPGFSDYKTYCWTPSTDSVSIKTKRNFKSWGHCKISMISSFPVSFHLERNMGLVHASIHNDIRVCIMQPDLAFSYRYIHQLRLRLEMPYQFGIKT